MALVEYLVSDRIAHITINRPEKRNAMNPELVSALLEVFEKAIEDQTVKVIILKARGSVFSAGADLTYLQQLQLNTDQDNFLDTVALKNLFQTIYESPKLVIAQVQGDAIAGGCGLASVCDIVFSIPEARFGYTEVKIGFVPALVACYLVRKLGESRSNELLLSGRLIDASLAEAYGLVNFVVDHTKIEQSVLNYAIDIVGNTSANSVTSTKQMIRMAQDLPLLNALEEAIQLNVRVRSSEDCKRGISAFLQKEKIKW